MRLFFFSSRRRHTRFDCDWSSDVCSSDLDILACGGFDLVAGNPPWVRGERVPAQVRETLATRYATWRPARGRGFAHLPDLAVAFVERALELVAPGGAAALLVPAQLASSGYAEPPPR